MTETAISPRTHERVVVRGGDVSDLYMHLLDLLSDRVIYQQDEDGSYFAVLTVVKDDRYWREADDE